MAGTKIVDLPALGRNLASTDLFELSLAGGTGSRKITGQEILNSTGITIGTTAITSGTVGRVLFEGTGNVVSESANLFWDNTNGRLGIGTSSPNRPLHVVGQSTFNNLIFNDTSATTVHTNIELKSDNAYETGLLLRSTTGLRWQIYVNNYTSNNFIFYNYKLGAQAMMIAGGTNNLLINTTTDAGFRLDVNGTARVGNDLTIGSNRYLKAFRWTNDDVTRALQIEGNSNFNVDAVNIISWNNNLLNNTKNILNIGLSSTVSTQSSGSTDFFNVLNIPITYNFTGGIHTVKGIYYNPTLTAMVGTTHYAFHSTSGRIRFEGLPTSSAGLSAGDIWNDAGTLKIV